jgi:hypothetical protein
MKGVVFTPPFPGAHRWFVISDVVDGEVLTLNITDAEKEESTCYLFPGDHPCITKRSAVRYRSAKAWPVQELRKNLGQCRTYSDLASAELLRKLADGARKSPDLAKKFLKFL